MSNKLFNCFPRSLKLLDYIIEKEKLEAYYNPHLQTGHIKIQYYYCGSYVFFMGKIENKVEKEKNVEKYEVYAKFSRENEYQLVSTNTILYERIPSFDPLRQILKKYNLHEMIKTAYLNIDYDDYD